MRTFICIGDTFLRIVDALNECFNLGYKGYQRGYKKLDDNYSAWFPQLETNGHAANRLHGWINTISSDGEVIYERNNDPQKLFSVDREDRRIRYVFAKFPHSGCYEFIGVFNRDPSQADKNIIIYHRIDTKADLFKYRGGE